MKKLHEIKIYEDMVLSVVLHECETGSLTLKEEGRLKVFKNWVLRRIFGSKKDKGIGEWGRPHKGELNDLYSSTVVKPQPWSLLGFRLV